MKQNERYYALVLTIIMCILLIGCVLTSCKTISVGTKHDRDSIRIEYRTDTLTIRTLDSVRIQLPCSDSIEVAYVDRWRTNTIHHSTAIHDTIRVCSTDTIYQPYEVPVIKTQNSRFATFCIWHTIIIWVLIVLAMAVWILKKFY